MTDDRPDRELVEAVVGSRDELAFRTLYRRHSPRLFRIAVRATGDRGGVAEDIVHDVWLRAVAGLAGFRWRSSLSTWLAGVLMNRVREVLRSADWRSTESAAGAEPAEETTGPEGRIDLDRAMAALPPGYRAVIILHDVEGYTHEEIAGILGIDAGTSKSQLSRARGRMRARLEPGGQRQ